MEVTILAVASNAVLDACVALGLERSALLEAAGLKAEQLEDPDGRVPAAAADAIWAAAIQRCGDPCLALHAAEALPFGAYRVVDFLAAHAPTLGEGLERIAAYFPLIDARAKLEWQARKAGGAVLSFVGADGRPIPRPAIEYSFAAIVLRSREGSGLDWRPEQVELRGPAGSEFERSELRRVFGVEPRFEAAEDHLHVSALDWTRPAQAGNRGLFEVLERHAAMLVAELPAPSFDLTRQLREAISAELRGGKVTLEHVGKRLGMSGRTLQRRLDEHALRFLELVEEVKAEHAKAYLDDRALALCEVAFLLGFADQSAFTRAFKRWTGQTPGRYRKRPTRA